MTNSKYQISNNYQSLQPSPSSPPREGKEGWVKFDIGYSRQGFTLIELLVVIAILSFVGSIVAVILTTSLRTSTKANIINNVKENGNYALTNMANTIRYAASVQCPPSPTPPTNVQVTAVDKSQVTFDCSGTTILSNGSSLLDTNSVSLVTNSCTITCTQPNPVANPLVQIKFSLQQNTSGQLTEQNASPVSFSTSVAVRNVNR